MSTRLKVFSGFRWTASARLASQVVSWAITLLVVRILTPADYGLLAMATAFLFFLQTFSELGLGSALVQKAELDGKLLRQAFGVILIVNFSLASLLALAAPLIAGFYGEPRVTLIVQVLSLQFVLSAFSVIPNVQLLRRMEFRNRSLLELSGTILSSICTLALALSGAGVWSLVIGSFVGQIWNTVGINVLSPFFQRPDFSLKGMRSLLSFGGNMTIAAVFGVFFQQSDTLIGARMLGNEIFGYYSVGGNLAAMPAQKISGLINGVAFPAFSSIQSDINKVGQAVLLGIRVLGFFAFPIMWGMSSIAPEIVEVVLGPKWSLSIVPLQLLTLIVPLRIFGNFVAMAVQGMGRADILLRNATWAALVGPSLLFCGVSLAGLNGLSMAWLAISPTVFISSLHRSLPAVGLLKKQLFSALSMSAGAGAFMYAAVASTRHYFASDLSGITRMCVLIAVGALAYCTVSLGLNRKGAAEVLDIVLSVARPKRAK